MKGQELIDYIKENNLEDFEIEVSVTDEEASDKWLSLIRIENIEPTDIGYSEKVLILTGDKV